MGSMQQAEYANTDLFEREAGLRAHIQGNFYTPHPAYVEKSMIEGFRKYWAGKITVDELREACYLYDMNGLNHYFGAFLNEENDDI
jgi:hypothetical protein